MKFFSGVVAVFLSLIPSARAWNAEGHMVVAQIAYDHLQPDVKTRCDALIGVSLPGFTSTMSSTFVTAAGWADDFKSSLGTGIWHYIDIPFSLDGTPTNGVTAASFDVVRAINMCVATLQNPVASQSTQAVCLRYLIHFVGDVQQPLHASTAVSAANPTGDAGGNDFAVKGFGSELHALWDEGGGFLTDSVGRPLSTTAAKTVSNKVALVESSYPYDYTTNLNIVQDPMIWAREGWSLAQTVAYVGITQGAAPSASYLNSVTNTTILRMAQGGHRLADLLNTIMGTNVVTLNSLAVTNGVYAFSWNGLTNRTYRVQWKPDLADPTWNDLTNLPSPGNQPVILRDTMDQPQRFYRVVQ